MCQVQSVTLQNAILMQVEEFANNNQQFSVHDITRTLREKTAQGELEIPETEISGASFRFDIPHQKVKSLFDELYRTGAFGNSFSLSRQFIQNMYFQYTPTLNAGVPSVTPAPVATAPVLTPSVPVAVASTTPKDIAARVALYLTNCVNKNFRPTLKQVQSAIKRGDSSTGVSCESLKTTVESLGYTVVSNPDSLSHAQVATVAV